MARVKFVHSSSGFREVLNSAGVGAMLLARVQPAGAVAKASAPRDTGEYADSIDTELVTTDRKVARVVAHDDKSMILESKTRNLGRALDAMGG